MINSTFLKAMVERAQAIDYSAVVNPATMEEGQMVAYLEAFERISEAGFGTSISYRGSQVLKRFIADGQVGIGTIVRVYDYGTTKDPQYVLTRTGWRSSRGETDLREEDFLERMDNGTLIAWSLVSCELIPEPDQS